MAKIKYVKKRKRRELRILFEINDINQIKINRQFHLYASDAQGRILFVELLLFEPIRNEKDFTF